MGVVCSALKCRGQFAALVLATCNDVSGSCTTACPLAKIAEVTCSWYSVDKSGIDYKRVLVIASHALQERTARKKFTYQSLMLRLCQSLDAQRPVV